MGVWEEHNLTSYPDYFNTDWWRYLKDMHIYSNEVAECYICSKRNSLYSIIKRKSILLLHHVSYKNLFKEKLWNDIYILCFNCHNQVHFWTIWNIKTPMSLTWLLFSMRLRKIIFYTQTLQIWRAVGWLLLVIPIGLVHSTAFVLKTILASLWHLAPKFLTAIDKVF